ncbi:hypothetical protein PENTCL1PPCAC_9497, partial [Pristionchus entomophagus]
IGATLSIECTYTRGNPVAEGSPLCGFCSLCWGYRQLPEEYYPTYVNEVMCSSDTTCLKGYGQCSPVTRSVNVLRKRFDESGSFEWEQVAIDIVVSCECQV